MIKVASFNLENLFTRPTAMNLKTDAAGAKALEDHGVANAIILKDVYTDQDKKKLIELSKKYGWHFLNPPKNALVQLQKVRGQLFKKPKNGDLEVVAKGSSSWTGWFELRKDDISWKATYNTGRVIAEANADVLICVEVENRPTLERFNKQVLKAEFNLEYPYYMVIDGNDARGIDLGILSKFPIKEIRSHVDDTDNNKKIFSRDCPEYDIELPGDKKLVIIPNHFKSKRNGNDTDSQNRRKLQAKTAGVIAKTALARSEWVIVGGDLNDTPDSGILSDLFSNGFKDIISHASYPTDRPGTFGTGLASNKIDYLILSPKLWSKVSTTGIERRGSYHPNIWNAFDTVTGKENEASDHQLIWVELSI